MKQVLKNIASSTWWSQKPFRLTFAVISIVLGTSLFFLFCHIVSSGVKGLGWHQDILNYMVGGILLMMFIYHLLLWVGRSEYKAGFYFAFCCLAVLVFHIGGRNFLGKLLPAYDLFKWNHKLVFLSLTLGSHLFLVFFFYLFYKILPRLLVRISQIYTTCLCLLAILTPEDYFLLFIPMFYTQCAITGVICFYSGLRGIITKRAGSHLVIVGILVMILSLGNDQLFEIYHQSFICLVPFGLVALIFSQSAVLAIRFSNAYSRVDQTLELRQHRDNLEELVGERTVRLNDANRSLQQELAERLRIQKELSQSEKRYLDLLEAIPDLVYMVDSQGNFVYLNSIIEKVLGYNRDELIGRHFKTILHPYDYRNCSCQNVLPQYQGKITGSSNSPKLFDERRTGKRMTRDLEVRLISKGSQISDENDDVTFGSVFSYGEIKAVGFYLGTDGDTNQLVGSVGIIRDTTERKKYENELQKSQKLETLGILAGGIAHDFNNYLQSILGNLQLAKMFSDEEEEKDSEFMQILEDAIAVSLRARDLTQQLLAFSKSGIPVKKNVDISNLLKKTVSFLIRGTNVKSRFEVDENLKWVCIDEGQIDQVINNIIINALQAMPEGGEIIVKAQNYLPHGDEKIKLDQEIYIKIEISDQGCGMPEDLLDKIFDPFYTTKQTGSGLGLAISYSIIKKHEGYIVIDSQLNQGTTFTLYLPGIIEQPEEVLPGQQESMAISKRVLIMDDDNIVLKTVKRMLTRLEHQVTTASEGQEVVNIYRQALDQGDPFEAVVLDLIVVGGIGGLETAELLLKLDPQAKLIISSGYSNNPVMVDYRKYGFVAAIIKPFTMNNLNDAIIGQQDLI